MDSRLIVVLGMHRSGTSAITRALQTMGVDLGNRLMQPVEHVNAKGFWEDDDITAINEQILHSLGMSWHSLAPLTPEHLSALQQNGLYTKAANMLREKVGTSPIYGFKDPRVAKLLPLWQGIFKTCGFQPSYLIAIRNPLSVAQSLLKRDGFNPVKSHLLWLEHVLLSLELSASYPHTVVDFDQLMHQPLAETKRIAAALELAINPAELNAYIESFIDEDLRHTVFKPEDLNSDPNCPPLACEVYRALLHQGAATSVTIDKWLTEFRRITPIMSLVDSLQTGLTKAEHTTQEFKQLIEEKDQLLKDRALEYSQEIHNRNTHISTLESAVVLRDQWNEQLTTELHTVINSNSWRATAPLRAVGKQVRRVARVTKRSCALYQQHGGAVSSTKKAYKIFKAEGINGFKVRLRKPIPVSQAAAKPIESVESILSIVPYYIDKSPADAHKAAVAHKSIAIHCHFLDLEDVNNITARLNNIPTSYSLFVSIEAEEKVDSLKSILQEKLENAKEIFVKAVPPGAGALASLIAQFGARLKQYSIVGNIATALKEGSGYQCYEATLDNLFPNSDIDSVRVAHILNHLNNDAKIVYSESYYHHLDSQQATWGDSYPIARAMLHDSTAIAIQDYPQIEYPAVPTFWSTSAAIRNLLNLKLKHSDFNGTEGELRKLALEKSVLLLAKEAKGVCLRLHKQDSIPDYRYYEDQYNYAEAAANTDIKILSYYLPQFHPTPENDEWHGKGFTEWTKVRAANPLFEGHFQQHIPHESLGYYDLESPETLYQQADMMKKAGVHGQIFYHYWFTGKLILEKPAQMLLANPDIDMPFCFCWANENWTRRWDGNESEILLGQNYSADDARAFIKYLIPFFQDKRYITVDGRPMLFVYRPSSIPDPSAYNAIWEEECGHAGLPKPYVVAVLTRGATDPHQFGMDAGTERVLHDWTDGGVADIRPSLNTYYPLTGSVLPYDEVSKYYRKQQEPKEFTYFRSLVPTWDNTARYGEGALLLHGSTPFEFQEWLQDSIEYSRLNLPADRRFILVNAWNEWAEGAHLEPDTRFGYSYLNSVGRAISGIKYSAQSPKRNSLPNHLRIHLQFSEDALSQLNSSDQASSKFLYCLRSSSIVQSTAVLSTNSNELSRNSTEFNYIQTVRSGGIDFIIHVNTLSLFDSDALQQLLEDAYNLNGIAIPNTYSRNTLTVTERATLPRKDAATAPILVVSQATSLHADSHKNATVSLTAHCFPLLKQGQQQSPPPEVTTIIRFHKDGEFSLLKNALYSLAAMDNCSVIPYIAAQDLNEEQLSTLDLLLKSIPFSAGISPTTRLFSSENGTGDLRSKMLNESLLAVTTRYATVLDYDDLLFPDAYDWLINRTVITGKAIAFGRVYSTEYDSKRQLILSRSRSFEYGYSYRDFISHNHAPIHSFLIDLERVSLKNIEYYDDQRYMEDYLLTLQIFTADNTDWDSLRENYYIGDYIHSIDRSHTLALTDDKQRELLRMTPEYQVCEQRIRKLRSRCL